MNEREPSKYEIEHSLIQKAVRRGNVELVEKVFNYLQSQQGSKWLKDRLLVIAYEECWPYAEKIYLPCSDYDLLQHYKNITLSVKNKNACGLAELAMKQKDGKDVSKVGNSTDQAAISSIKNAILYPTKFWEWVKKEPEYQKYKSIIDKAEQVIKRVSSEFDKAMVYAAVYLTIKFPIPEIKTTPADNDPDFPYWIAIDKHTSVGKDIYIEICEKLSLDTFITLKLGFYLAGSKCNEVNDSPFWELIKKWQLESTGFLLNEVNEKWEEISREIKDSSRIKVEVESTIKKINTPKPDSDQLSFF